MRRGFTFIELLIVVMILAILAAVAIPIYKRFTYVAKRSEAIQNLGCIRGMEEVYSGEKNSYVSSEWSPTNVPGSIPTDDRNGSAYLHEKLKFYPQGKVYYRYSVGNATGHSWTSAFCELNPETCFNNAPSENGFLNFRNTKIDIVVKAEGDLDGDGETGKMFVTDEPPGKITYVNYSTY